MFSTGTAVEGAVNYTNANAVCGESVTGDVLSNVVNQGNLSLPVIQSCAQPMGARWIASVTNWLCFLIDGAGLEFAAGSTCQDPLLLLKAVKAIIASEICVKPGSAYPDNSDEVCAASPAYVWAAIQANANGQTISLITEADYPSYDTYSLASSSGYNSQAATPGYILEAILEQPIATTTTNGIAREATSAEMQAGATSGSVPAFVTPEGLAGIGPLGPWQGFLHPNSPPPIGSQLNYGWTSGMSFPGTGEPFVGQIVTLTSVSATGSDISDWGTNANISTNYGNPAHTFEILNNNACQLGTTWLIISTWISNSPGGASSTNYFSGSAVRLT